MTPLQAVLTIAYIGGIVLVVKYGYRLIVRFARSREATTLPPTPEREEVGSTGDQGETHGHGNEAAKPAAEGVVDRYFPEVASVLVLLNFCTFAGLMGLQWRASGASIAVPFVLLAMAVVFPYPFYRDLWHGRTWALAITAVVSAIATVISVGVLVRAPWTPLRSVLRPDMVTTPNVSAALLVLGYLLFWAMLSWFSGRMVWDRIKEGNQEG